MYTAKSGKFNEVVADHGSGKVAKINHSLRAAVDSLPLARRKACSAARPEQNQSNIANGRPVLLTKMVPLPAPYLSSDISSDEMLLLARSMALPVFISN